MPQQKLEDMTIPEKMELVRTLSLFPAITVMVFIRRKLGFRMMKPTWLVVLTIIMLLIPVVFSAVAQPFGFLMVIYALAMLGLGLFQRWQRWKELCNGERWIDITSTNVGRAGVETPHQTSGITRSEQRRYFVEPSRFTTLKRGGPHHNYQVESIVYNGGHRFPTGAPGKEESLPYKLITFNQK